MPMPTANLEPPPKSDPTPIVSYRAFRTAYTHDDRPCSKCGKPTERFADAVHDDGNVTGWTPICEACVPTPARPDLKAQGKPTAAQIAEDAVASSYTPAE